MFVLKVMQYNFFLVQDKIRYILHLSIVCNAEIFVELKELLWNFEDLSTWLDKLFW